MGYDIAYSGNVYRIFSLLFVLRFIQAVNRRPLITGAWVQSQDTMWVCGGASVTGRALSPITAVFPSQFHITSVPYPFICVSNTLYSRRNQRVSLIKIKTFKSTGCHLDPGRKICPTKKGQTALT